MDFALINIGLEMVRMGYIQGPSALETPIEVTKETRQDTPILGHDELKQEVIKKIDSGETSRII